MAIRTLLERQDGAGIYRVVSVDVVDEATGESGGIYVNIARYDGSGYSRRCSGYTEAADVVAAEHGQVSD